MATLAPAPVRPLRAVAAVRGWHLLSLDAPCVAALWTTYLAWLFKAPLPAIASLTLALAVWLLYTLDRIVDAARGDALQERHRVHGTRRMPLLLVCGIVAALLPVLLALLPHGLAVGWLLLTLPLALYVVAVHGFALRRVPKELVVAVFFAAAAAVPLVAHQGRLTHPALLALFDFGGLCWLNCAAIARWECTLPAADPLTRWLGHHLDAAAALVVVAATPLLGGTHTASVLPAVIMAAGGLLLLERLRSRLEPATVRALADAALLTPLVTWPVAWWLHLR